MMLFYLISGAIVKTKVIGVPKPCKYFIFFIHTSLYKYIKEIKEEAYQMLLFSTIYEQEVTFCIKGDNYQYN
jgi:hypothetical protein